MSTIAIVTALTVALAAPVAATDQLEPPAPPVEASVETIVDVEAAPDLTLEVVAPAAPTITPVCEATFDDEPNVLAITIAASTSDGYYYDEGWLTDDVVSVEAYVTDPAVYALDPAAVTEWTYDVAAMLPDCDTERHDDEDTEPVVETPDSSDDAPTTEQDAPELPELPEHPAAALDLSALHASVMYRVR